MTALDSDLVLDRRADSTRFITLNQLQSAPGVSARMLAKPGYGYFTVLYDNGHCPAAARASEWPAVVNFGWLQGDAVAAAEAGYSRGASWTGLMLSLVAS